MIRLIVCDLDGTALGHDMHYAPGAREALQTAQARGLTVTLATGRGAQPTAHFAAELGLTAPLICFQGGHIYDPNSQTTLYETRLDPRVIPVVNHLAQQHGWLLHFETPQMLYLTETQNYPEALHHLIRVSAWTEVRDFLTDLPEVPHKFILTARRPEERPALEHHLRQLAQHHHLPLDVFASHAYLVEGMPAGVHKAAGLAWLAAHLGIDRREVLALGDNDNDATMLRWAGVGVAMGNASPAALAAADWVAPACEAGGVAAAIEKFVLTP